MRVAHGSRNNASGARRRINLPGLFWALYTVVLAVVFFGNGKRYSIQTSVLVSQLSHTVLVLCCWAACIVYGVMLHVLFAVWYSVKSHSLVHSVLQRKSRVHNFTSIVSIQSSVWKPTIFFTASENSMWSWWTADEYEKSLWSCRWVEQWRRRTSCLRHHKCGCRKLAGFVCNLLMLRSVRQRKMCKHILHVHVCGKAVPRLESCGYVCCMIM